MKNSARITMVQLQDLPEKAPSIERMPAFFEQAAQNGSDLIVFPEYTLGQGITEDHENIVRFRELAQKHNMYAIAGCVEKHDNRGATTALLVDRFGNIIGRYLKAHPAAGPGPHWWPPIKDWDGEARGILGSEFKVFHLDFGPIGILQCYDGYFPEAWASTSYAGAEIILWINGRDGMVEDFHCLSAASAFGCAVGGNISNGKNTGFAGPFQNFVSGEGDKEESRLFPRIKEAGDACVHAEIDLAGLRHHRKHLRTMHQRRPELYGRLTKDVKMWQNYPEIPWDYPECEQLTNRSQL
ncbi:carbon-nitrogen hydrolase family protein [Pelagicoccus mobilis]|uniref:Carbon-nitrogen hydrolase family protein n=1 Tax=Pelagicoccus mobilis TaxID=415221 RepID=A0A934S147_9BACT|nr:carbon-nitrogen hydrolase family protein [Pelagicoccus mobilis]MBK1877188.1 carbon-nitrogen hydrolase family protein [Pelagicoccus mobilis]